MRRLLLFLLQARRLRRRTLSPHSHARLPLRFMALRRLRFRRRGLSPCLAQRTLLLRLLFLPQRHDLDYLCLLALPALLPRRLIQLLHQLLFYLQLCRQTLIPARL
jgi:hypothetical protein